MLSNKICKGDIYLADLGDGRGSIQGGVRPVVVISNQLNNKFSPTVNILPITSKLKNNIPVHVTISIESGLTEESTILTEQMLTINKYQLIKQIGKCNKDKMVQIASALILQTDLGEYLPALAI